MTKLIRTIALVGCLGSALGVGCTSVQTTSTSPRLPASRGIVAVDKASNNRISPPPSFVRKSNGVFAFVKTTAYCHLEADSLQYGRKCALGCDLRFDNVRSAAADWSVYPAGTLFKIAGQPYIYRIDDYGSALVGTRTIDLYQPTKSDMRAWGARNVEIEIIKWGSYSKSLEVLSDRTKHAHVQAMVSSIRRKKLVG